MIALRNALAKMAGFGALFLVAAPALAQRIGQGTGTEVPVWRVLGALALCLGLALAAAFVLRRRLGGPLPLAMGRARRLQLVETVRLGPQVHLCLVSCDGTEFLVAASAQGATTIRQDLRPNLPARADESSQ
jgi:flagellar biogenesis protein FliO